MGEAVGLKKPEDVAEPAQQEADKAKPNRVVWCMVIQVVSARKSDPSTARQRLRPVCRACARSSSVRAASTHRFSAFEPLFLGACGFSGARSSSVRAASTCRCSAFKPQFLGACGFAGACTSSVRAAASRYGTGACQTEASFVVRCASVNFETACCGSDNV